MSTAVPRPLHPDDVGFGRVFDTLRDALVVLDLSEGRVRLCNPAALRLFGVSEGEALGRPLEELVRSVEGSAGTARPNQAEELRAAMPGDEAPVELRLRTSTGREVLVEATFTPLAVEGTSYTLATLRDITARRRAEEATRATFALLSATLEATGEAILVVDEAGKIACANQKVVELWGMPGLLLGSTDPTRTLGFVLDHLADASAFAPKIRELEQRTDASSHDLLRLRDGRTIEAWSQPMMVERRLAGRVWCFRDVTDRLRAEERLRTTEEQYRTLVEGVQAIVWRGDADTFAFTFVSKEAEAILGYPVEEWTRDPEFWVRHIHPDDRDWALQYCQRAIAQGRSHVFEYRMVAADGRTVWLRDVVRVRAEEGKPTELFGVMLDVTQRRHSEETQQQALEHLLEIDRLKATAAAKTELLRTAGHELNTPLSTLHSVVDMLRDDSLGPLTPEQQQAVDMLDRNVDRLMHLVRGVLEAARLQSGRLVLRTEPLDLGSLVEEVAERFREPAQRNDVRVQVVVSPGLQVQGDRDRLDQVFANLLTNALKYTPSGGTVSLTASVDEGEALVRVQDSGPGLTLEEQAQLFQAFGRMPSGGAAPADALGLYLCRGLVEEHGGRIWAESPGLGLGTTFSVALPLRSAEADVVILSSDGPRESLPPA